MADDEPPLTHHGWRVGIAFALALVTLVALLGGGATSAQWGLGPTATEKLATKTATPTPSDTAVPTPTPTPTSIPTFTPTITNTPTPTPTGPRPYEDWAVEKYGPPWTVDCDNEATEDGYRHGAWARGFCVPGLITFDAWWYDSPSDFYGVMSSYAPGVMEAQVRAKGYDDERVRGVALMSCGDIHKTAWLRPAGRSGWSGPFKVVDCSQRNHMYYHVVGMGLVVEVGYAQTERWGFRTAGRIDVHIGSGPPGAWSGVYYPYWWVENKLAFDGVAVEPQLVPAKEYEIP